MSEILTLEAIERIVAGIDLCGEMERGFVAYSQGRAVVPPVGEMLFEEPPGDVHIKYGYIRGDDTYVIKVASGFYDNPKLGLPSSGGLMLLFCQKTGALLAVLLDDGRLTDLRTAAAGAVAARYLAPKTVRRIGIVGAGTQARLQLQHLCAVVRARRALVWTPDPEEIPGFEAHFAGSDMGVESTQEIREIPASCDLIVTATPSKSPLLLADDIRPGTHITAVGADTAEKTELFPGILARADRVVVDSLSQSHTRGEVFRAAEAGAIDRDQVVELGQVIGDPALGRTGDTEITVADLTGVAVQDIQIAKAVYENRNHPSGGAR